MVVDVDDVQKRYNKSRRDHTNVTGAQKMGVYGAAPYNFARVKSLEELIAG